MASRYQSVLFGYICFTPLGLPNEGEHNMYIVDKESNVVDLAIDLVITGSEVGQWAKRPLLLVDHPGSQESP